MRKDAGRDYNYNPKRYEYIQAQHTWQSAQYIYDATVQNSELSFRTLYQKVRDDKQILAAAVLTLCGCQGTDEPQETGSDSTGVPMQVQTVSQQTIYAENKVSGKVISDNETPIIVAATAKCTAVYVEAGDTVSAGDTLCKLELDSTQTSYAAASLSYQSAAQSYRDQKEVFDRQIALYEKNLNDLKALQEVGAASQLEIDQAQLQLDSAIATRNATLSQLEAGMESYKSSMEQLNTVLEHVDASGNVIAPVSGTITSLSAVENSYISAQAPVAVIDGIDQMKISVSVSESLVPKLSVGDEVEVSVSAADQTFTGSIRSVDKAANAQTKLYTVTVSIPEGAEGLLPGMFADVTFHTDSSEQAVVIPTEAILTSGTTQYVFVVDGDTAVYTEVSTGLTAAALPK